MCIHIVLLSMHKHVGFESISDENTEISYLEWPSSQHEHKDLRRCQETVDCQQWRLLWGTVSEGLLNTA